MKAKNVIKAMKSTDQIPGKQTVYEHGKSVWKNLSLILGYLETGKTLPYSWVPSWLEYNREYLKSKLLNRKLLRRYAVFHDLGKPWCMTIDPDG